MRGREVGLAAKPFSSKRAERHSGTGTRVAVLDQAEPLIDP